jgi:DNA-binding response OmpR family regulator
VLLFSPDHDLAKSLSLLLEREFEIVCETRLEQLRQRIEAVRPDVILLDLYAFPSDVEREIEVLRTIGTRIPTIVLRVKRLLNVEVERVIGELADLTIYKPFDSVLLGEAIHKVMDA